MERDHTTMLVARNIETLMEQKGLDAAKLARASGINPTGIYDILKGKSRSPKIETIAKIAKGLGVPLATVFSGQPTTAADDLLVIFEQLDPERRAILMQAARAWIDDEVK